MRTGWHHRERGYALLDIANNLVLPPVEKHAGGRAYAAGTENARRRAGKLTLCRKQGKRQHKISTGRNIAHSLSTELPVSLSTTADFSIFGVACGTRGARLTVENHINKL